MFYEGEYTWKIHSFKEFLRKKTDNFALWKFHAPVVSGLRTILLRIKKSETVKGTIIYYNKIASYQHKTINMYLLMKLFLLAI